MISGLPPAHEAPATQHPLYPALRAVVATALAIGLALGSLTARADSLDDQKKKVADAIAQSKHDLAEYSQEARQAAVALQASQQKLEAAQQALAQANTELAGAQAEDARIAAELKVAQDELAKAQAAAAKAKAEVEAFQVKIGSRAREQMQQRTSVTGLAILVTDTTSGDLAQKLQWSTTIFDSSGAQMDRLRALKLAADAAQAKATEAEAKVAAARQRAAENLARSQQLQQQAANAQNQVAAATAELGRAKAAADQQVAGEQARQADLVNEQNAVNRRIAARLAEQKRLAAAKAEAERKAAAQREAAKAAAAKQAAANKRNTSTTSRSKPTSNPTTSNPQPASNGLIYPVSAPITSSYGMRLHPILGVWKLHDGTDFGAGCGAPMRAAADGVVTERYFNAGYGNRLMIDHGLVNGTYLTTGYNHATSYVVSVGQRVTQGQVIGYVGTTGYSTGCHLHLMVWANGSVTNPMNYF